MKTEFSQGPWNVSRLHEKGIWQVACDHPHDLAMLFWRVQEFYECPNPKFRGKAFSMQDYMDWYAKNASPTGSFSYASDWGGFNIPMKAIRACAQAGHPDLNRWDASLAGMVECIVAFQGSDNIYLVGAPSDNKATLNHEIAHGLFCVDKQYRENMKSLLKAIAPKRFAGLLNAIANHGAGGYAKAVILDEAQAYLATGLEGEMREFSDLAPPFRKAFRQALMDSITPVSATRQRKP